MEEAITLDELKSVVINSKNYKSPGHYGLTNIFYKTFWPEIGNFLLDLMNYYNEQGELNDTQKAGIMTFIPKVNKSLKQLKKMVSNNSTEFYAVYNFLSATSTKRIKSVLDKIIHHEEKDFITTDSLAKIQGSQYI